MSIQKAAPKKPQKQPAKRLINKTAPNSPPKPPGCQWNLCHTTYLTLNSTNQWSQLTSKTIFCHTLVSSQRKYMKELFKFWMDRSSAEATPFLTFQTVQNRHKGAALHTSFILLSTKDPFQPFKSCLIEEWKSKATPKKEENKKAHNTLILTQWSKLLSINFSFLRHLFAKDLPLFLSWSRVKTFPHAASILKINKYFRLYNGLMISVKKEKRG